MSALRKSAKGLKKIHENKIKRKENINYPILRSLIMLENEEFKITIKNYRCFSDENPAEFIIRNGFTAFVGPNNAGKSTILRFFHEMKVLFARLSQEDNLKGFLQKSGQNVDFPDCEVDDLFCNSNDRNIEILIELEQKKNSSQKESSSVPPARGFEIIIDRETKICFLGIYGRGRNYYMNDHGFDIRNRVIDSADGNGGDVRELSLYLKLFENISKTLFIPAFRNAIGITGGEYFGMPVGQKVIEFWGNSRTGVDRRFVDLSYKVMSDLKEIFGYEELDIVSDNQQTRLNVRVNGKQYEMSELGAGFCQFFMILTNLALREYKLILIDEPELNLHPTLQLSLLTVLGTYADYGVFYGTHNYGLAISGSDRIYSLSWDDNDKTRMKHLEDTPRLPEFLGEMNFSSYKEIGFSKVLLVEGPTDIKVFKMFLRMFHVEKEFVILDLGGDSNINGERVTEFEEITRISDKIYAIIDSEKTSKEGELTPNRVNFKDLCDKLNIECHVLERRAIENYLCSEAIKHEYGEKYQALGDFNFPKKQFFWGKRNNWKIVRRMSKKDINGTDLGEFLEIITKKS